MKMTEHLGELRRRLIVCMAAFVLLSLVGVIAYEPILHFLIKPLCDVNRAGASGVLSGLGAGSANGPDHCRLLVTSPTDGISLRIKIAVFSGLVMSSPVILFEIWRFITPGLRHQEKKYVVPFVAASSVLFLLGAATAYYVLPHALGFLESVGGPSLQNVYNPIPYLSLIVLMMGFFGLTFQFPVILVSLELARVVTPARLLHSWRWAVILIVVVAGVFIPSSDPFSMLAFAVPLIFFYFVAIGIGKLCGR